MHLSPGLNGLSPHRLTAPASFTVTGRTHDQVLDDFRRLHAVTNDAWSVTVNSARTGPRIMDPSYVPIYCTVTVAQVDAGPTTATGEFRESAITIVRAITTLMMAVVFAGFAGHFAAKEALGGRTWAFIVLAITSVAATVVFVSLRARIFERAVAQMRHELAQLLSADDNEAAAVGPSRSRVQWTPVFAVVVLSAGVCALFGAVVHSSASSAKTNSPNGAVSERIQHATVEELIVQTRGGSHVQCNYGHDLQVTRNGESFPCLDSRGHRWTVTVPRRDKPFFDVSDP